VTAGSRAADSVELARIGFGGDLQDRTVMTSLINASSPLVWDATMLAATQEYATPTRRRSSRPSSSRRDGAGHDGGRRRADAGRGARGHDVRAARAPGRARGVRLVRVVDVDADRRATFGTPEPSLVLYTCAQLARRLGVPFRSGGSLCASKLPDAQAAYESANTLQATVLGGVTSSCTRRAGSKAASRSVTRSSSSTTTSSA